MFGLIVFTKAGIGDTNPKLYMRRYPVNSSGLDCKSGVGRLWECKSLAAHQERTTINSYLGVGPCLSLMLEYVNGSD